MSYLDFLRANMPLMRPQEQAPPVASPPSGSGNPLAAAIIAQAISNQRQSYLSAAGMQQGMTRLGASSVRNAERAQAAQRPVMNTPEGPGTASALQPIAYNALFNAQFNRDFNQRYDANQSQPAVYGGSTPGAAPVTPEDAQRESLRRSAATNVLMGQLQPSRDVSAIPSYIDYVSSAMQANLTPPLPPNADTTINLATNSGPVEFQPDTDAYIDNPNVLAEKALTGAVEGAIGLPVVGGTIKKGLEQFQRPFNWNIKNVGDSIYSKANGGSDGQTVGGVNWNPTYYIVESWATDPTKKDAINAAYTIGLDLNKDGTIDVQGGEAVMMAYFADKNPGFLDQMIAQLAFDPLFYAMQVGPLAKVLREGAAVAGANEALVQGAARAAKGTTALSKTEIVLQAVEEAMAKVERAGEIGIKVADAPITVPIAVARKVGNLTNLTKEGGLLGKALGPAGRTAETTARTEATDIAGQALRAEDLPPAASAESAVPGEQVATNLPAEVTPGEVVPGTTITDAIPIEAMTREERNLALKAGTISVTDPIPGGPRLIDKAADRFPTQPVEAAAFKTKYDPLAAKWQAEDAEVTSRLRPVDERLDQIRKVEVPAAKQALRGYLPDDHPLITEQAPLFVAKRALESERVLIGIEHVVNDVAPVFKESFGDLPPIAPSAEPAAQVQAINRKTGSPLSHEDGTPVMVDAAYRDQPLPYLFQRYVYEDSAKKAANTIEAIRKRPDFMTQPNAAETLQRLEDSRKLLNDLKAERDITQMGAPVKEPEAPLSPAAVEPDPGAFSIDEQVARGELSQEAGTYLNQKIVRYRAKVDKAGKPSLRGRWKDMNQREWEAFSQEYLPVPSAKTEAFMSKGVKFTEAETPLDILQRIRNDNPDLSSAEIQDIFSSEMARATGKAVPPTVDLHPVATRILNPGKKYVQSLRSSALHNPVTGGRGIIQDRLSDPLRLAMEGMLPAAIESLNPAHWARKALGRTSELRKTTDFFGMDPINVSMNRGRTEVALAERTATHELVSDILLRKPGSLSDKAVGIATGMIDTRTIARARSGLDDVTREVTAKHIIDLNKGAMVREFTERARLMAEKSDIQAASVNAYLSEAKDMTPATVRETMTELGRDAGLPDSAAVHFGNKLAEDWRHRVGELRNKANAEQKRVLFSFERTKLDEKLGGIIFYHYWMTRAIPAYARIALRNPEIAAMWMRGWQDMERRAERDGYPDSVKGVIRFMGSMDGMYGLWDPWNIILPVADMMPDTPDRAPLFDKATQFVALSPIVQMAATVIGASNRIPDPLGIYAIRKMGLAIVNKIRADSGRPPMMADAWAELITKGFQLANDIVGQAPIPGFAERAFLDPAAVGTSELRNVVAAHVAEQTGVPVEQWVEGDDNYELWVQTIADGEAGIANPLYQEAFQEWADFKLKGTIINSLIPGGVRVRYGPRDELLAGDLTDQQDEFKTIMNSGSAADAKLDILNAQYQEIGTPRQQSFSQSYNDISNPKIGFGKYEIPPGSLVTIHGKQYTVAGIAALEEDDRKLLAKAWVAENGGTEELDAYWDERSAWVDAHPEYGSFKEYTDTAYNYEGGPHQFRIDRAKGNPNFKQGMDDHRDYLLNVAKIDPKTLDAELDAWATSLAAYKAAQGIKDYIYDPDPKSTGDQATVDSIVRSIGSGGGFGEYTKKTNAEKLQDDITKYDTDMAIVTELMTSYGWDPALLESHNPYTVDTLQRVLGDLMPHKSTLQKQYELWVGVQDDGIDTSVDAFGRYLDELKAKQAA